MINTNNDVSNTIEVNQKPVGKVIAVSGVSTIQNRSGNSSDLQKATVIKDRSVDGQQVIDAKELGEAVQKANQDMQSAQREINFSVDKESGITVIKIIDLATEEVIRQIPNEETLSFARHISEGGELKLISELA